jgi:hypothetical protein
LTERLADSGIEEYTLRLRQMTEYRKTLDVVVTPDEPRDFLNVQPANASAVGFAIEDTLETLLRLGMTFHLSLADLLQKLESRNPCYLMNTLAVREGQITQIGQTVFEKGQRRGSIPFEETKGIVFLVTRMRYKPHFDYVVTLDGELFTLETTLKKRSVKPRYDGFKPTFDIDMKFEAVGQYPSKRIRITDELRHDIARMVKEQLEKDIRGVIETSQKKFECDYLSFSEPFRIAFPEAYEVLDWHEEFKKAEFNVHLEVNVTKNRIVDYDPETIV